jgi:hypothetical protein
VSCIRIDSDSTHGWQARVYVAKDRPRLTMMFSDIDWGGSDRAHKAGKLGVQLLELKAQAWRRRELLVALERLVPAP